MKKSILWAPWRVGYIQHSKKEKGCLFCRVLKSKNDAKNLVILRSKHTVALLNLYPYTNGHVIVSPLRHVKSLEYLNEAEILDLMHTVNRIKQRLDRLLHPDGFNIGINIGRAGGAGIAQHVHVHIVPRWFGDVNFMPVLFETKIISQSLKQVYRALTKR